MDLLALSELLYQRDAHAAAFAAGGGAGAGGCGPVLPDAAGGGSLARASCAVISSDGKVQIVVHQDLRTFLDMTVAVQATIKRFQTLQVSV